MKHIQPEASLAHPSSKAVAEVAEPCHRSQKGKRSKISISQKQYRSVGRNIRIIFPEIPQAEHRAEYCRKGCRQKEGPFENINDFFMRQDKVAQQKDKEIQSEPVHNNDRRIEDLAGPIDRYCHGNKNRQHRQSRLPAELFPIELPQPVPLDPAHRDKQQRKQPQELNVPQNPDPAQHTDQCLGKERYAGCSLKEPSQGDVDISLYKLKSQESDRRRHQIFSRPSPDEFPGSVSGQIKPCADPGNHKQQHHEPGIYNVLVYIPILHVQIRDLSGDTRNPFRIVHIEYVIHGHDHRHGPFDIIQIVFSHIYPTFAIIVNTIIKPGQEGVHQPNLTFTPGLCQI